jgi:hypothetical protein
MTAKSTPTTIKRYTDSQFAEDCGIEPSSLPITGDDAWTIWQAIQREAAKEPPSEE